MTQDRDRASALPSEDAKEKLTQLIVQFKLETGVERTVWNAYLAEKRSLTLLGTTLLPWKLSNGTLADGTFSQAKPSDEILSDWRLLPCQPVATALRLKALDSVDISLQRIATQVNPGSADR